MKSSRYIYVCAVALSAFGAQAQDLQREVTVDREIEPATRTATRMSGVTPTPYVPKLRLTPLKSAEYSGRGTLTRTLTRLEPAAYADTFDVSPYKGYVSAGYFPTYNLGVSAGYSLLSSRDTRLGVFLQYDGESHHGFRTLLPDGDDKSLTAARHLATVGFDAGHRFNKTNAIDMSMSYSYGATTTPLTALLKTQGQSANIVDLTIGYHNTGRVSWNVGFDLDYLGYGKKQIIPVAGLSPQEKFKPIKQSVIALTGDVTFSNFNIALDASVANLNHRATLLPAPSLNGATDSYNALLGEGSLSTGIIMLTPSYKINREKWGLQLGLNVAWVVNDPDNHIHLSPAVRWDWAPASAFSLWIKAGGGDAPTRFNELYHQSPWMPSVYSYTSTYAPVIADAGINIGPWNGFSAELFGGYAVVNNALMPYIVDGTALYRATDMRGAHYGVKLSYDWQDKVTASLGVEGASHGDYDKGYYLWADRAKYHLDASVTARPVSALEVTLAYKLATSRRSWILTSASTDVLPIAWYEANDYMTLGNIADLSVEGRYSFSPELSVFGRVGNLLCRRHIDISLVASQRINGLVGVNYKF